MVNPELLSSGKLIIAQDKRCCQLGNLILMRREVRKISIRAARKAKGLTQKQLAEMLGVNQSAVAFWENGQNMPTAKRLQEIARILACTVDDLLREDTT